MKIEGPLYWWCCEIRPTYINQIADSIHYYYMIIFYYYGSFFCRENNSRDIIVKSLFFVVDKFYFGVDFTNKQTRILNMGAGLSL